MQLNRPTARAVVAVVATLALFGGVIPSVSAAEPSTRTTSRTATSMTSAERCAKEKQDVKRARHRLAKAKRADEHRAAKVRKAKADVRKQKHQRAKWCGQAAAEAKAVAQADATKAAWNQLRTSAPVQALPKDIQKAMFAAVARVLGLVDTVKTTQVPGGTPDELSQVAVLLTALDPGEVQTSTAAFVDKLTTSTSKPDALSSYVTMLLSGLPAGTTLPTDSDAARLQKVMRDLVAALQAFQPAGGGPEVDKVVVAIRAATEGLQAASESGDLEQFLTAVTEVNGGSEPTPEQLTALFDYLLAGVEPFPFPMPLDVDGLAALDTMLGSVGGLVGADTVLPGADLLVPLITDTVSDLIDGGVDPTDITDAVDPGGVVDGIVDEVVGGLPPLLP
jgi:hypothetical protein